MPIHVVQNRWVVSKCCYPPWTLVARNQKRKEKALLLHYMDAQCYDIYETLKDETYDYAAAKTKMND